MQLFGHVNIITSHQSFAASAISITFRAFAFGFGFRSGPFHAGLRRGYFAPGSHAVQPVGADGLGRRIAERWRLFVLDQVNVAVTVVINRGIGASFRVSLKSEVWLYRQLVREIAYLARL